MTNKLEAVSRALDSELLISESYTTRCLRFCLKLDLFLIGCALVKMMAKIHMRTFFFPGNFWHCFSYALCSWSLSFQQWLSRE